MSDLPSRSPISISHIDIGSYLVTLAGKGTPCDAQPLRGARQLPPPSPPPSLSPARNENSRVSRLCLLNSASALEMEGLKALV